jgi:uncharacterized protein YodC (DUF2158 family)
MSDGSFKPGDVVRLRSGGPVMTVESIGSMVSADSVNCVWFEKTKQMSGSFAPATLAKYTPGPRFVSVVRR